MTFDALSMDPDQESALIRLENLGRYITSENKAIFKEVISRVPLSGVINITNWTREAIYELLSFLHESHQSIALKNGSRYFTPVIFPQGPLLDSLVDAIVTGEL